MKTCRKCQKQLDESKFYKYSRAKDGLQRYCKECQLSISKKYRKDNGARWKQYIRKYDHKNPDSVMLRNAKTRAKKFNREFNITRADIREVYTLTCPICGKEMKCGINRQSSDSPTLDRIDNNLGYIKGNIQVICNSCNIREG